MAIHSGTIAWKIPWTEEPGTLQSMGPQRVGHDLATKPTNQTVPQMTVCEDRVFKEVNGTPLQYFCLENPMDRGAW